MTKSLVNVYDFDHTVYRGDVSLDFIKYCMLRRPALWAYVPGFALALVRFVLGVSTRRQVKEAAFAFIKSLPNTDAVIASFVEGHIHKIAEWYTSQKQASDVIVSASPEFLLRPFADRLGVKTVIATRMDLSSGKIKGKNCRGVEKVRRLDAYNRDHVIDQFYSDHLSDAPLAARAKRPFVVKGGAATEWAAYKPSLLTKLHSRKFVRFVLVSGANAGLAILFAFLISLLAVDPSLAFILGYWLGMVTSYLLNGAITFKERHLSLGQFAKYCISYIPSFLLQTLSVYVLANQLGLYPLIAYILAVTITVPLTFLLLVVFTFKIKGED